MPTETVAAKSLVGAPARQLRVSADQLLADIQTFVQVPAALRERAKSQVQSLLQEQALARLAAIPLSAPKGSVPRGTRLGVVENGGFRTVGTVLAASPAALARIPGVGAGSAAEIYSAASRVAVATREGEVIRFDISGRPPAQTALLAS